MAGIKLDSFGGGAGEKRNGSGERNCKNWERMRSILSLKKSRNVLAREDASGDSGSEFEGFAVKDAVEQYFKIVKQKRFEFQSTKSKWKLA